MTPEEILACRTATATTLPPFALDSIQRAETWAKNRDPNKEEGIQAIQEALWDGNFCQDACHLVSVVVSTLTGKPVVFSHNETQEDDKNPLPQDLPVYGLFFIQDEDLEGVVVLAGVVTNDEYDERALQVWGNEGFFFPEKVKTIRPATHAEAAKMLRFMQPHQIRAWCHHTIWPDLGD